MKNLGVIGLAVMLVLGTGGMAWAEMEEGFGPWSGMMGHGMMGHGMMGHGWSGPRGESDWHSMGFSVSGLTLTKEQAAQIAQAHVQALGNPNLKLGQVIEFEPYYEAPIVTREGSFVEKLLVDKRTGWVRSVY